MSMHQTCPTECSGGGSHRQRTLNDAQLEQLSENARAALVEGRTAKRCSYCGCVYTDGGVLGWLDNAIRGEGWYSAN